MSTAAPTLPASTTPPSAPKKFYEWVIPGHQVVGIIARYIVLLIFIVYAEFFFSRETLNNLYAVIQASVGVLLGLFAFLFIAGPLFSRALTNNPNAHRPEGFIWDEKTKHMYPKSTFGFFTTLEPGRIKITEIGENFVSALMKWPRRKFFGEKPDNTSQHGDDDYTEICMSGDFRDSHPVPFPGFKSRWWWFMYWEISTLWWIWKRFVYFATGAIFTGIWPIKKVRVYKMEYFRTHTHEETGDITLEKVVNYSDHFRAAQFDLVILVSSAETADLLASRVLLVVVGRVVNPYRAAYNSNGDWAGRTTSAISHVILNYAKVRKLDEVVAAKNPDKAAELEQEILMAGKIPEKSATTRSPLADIGITIERVQVLDISVADPEARKRVVEEAYAQVDKKAAIIRAEGEKKVLMLRGEGLAKQIEKTGEALRKEPDGALNIEIEGNVRAAQALKDGLLVLGGETRDVAKNAAVLKELRDLNNKLGGRT